MGPLGEEQLERVSPTEALAGGYDRAVRMIGEQQLKLASMERTINSLKVLLREDAQRIELLTEARNRAHGRATEIASEFAAWVALSHNAMPGSGRLQQSDLDELKAALEDASETALSYLQAGG